EALGESGSQARFPDPRLARDQHNLSFAFPREPFALQQKSELVLAADEVDETCRTDSVEAALGRRNALDRPRRDRFSNTLELVPAKVAQAEKAAEQPTCGGGDYNRSGLGQGLESGRQVGRVPDQSLLPQRTLATEIADHYKAARDANANRERLGGTRFKPRNGRNNIKPRAHGSLGIILVRAGIAEICQYPVAPKLPDEAIIGQHDTGAGGVISIQHRVHVLRIESS